MGAVSTEGQAILVLPSYQPGGAGVNDLDVEESEEPDEPEDVFRRVMDFATDEAWDLQVDEEALAALYDVLHVGRHRRSGRGCRPRGTRPRPE